MKEYESGKARFDMALHPLAIPPDTKTLQEQIKLKDASNEASPRVEKAQSSNAEPATLIQAPYRLGLSPLRELREQPWQMRGLKPRKDGELAELWSARAERIQMRAVWSPDYRSTFWPTGITFGGDRPYLLPLDDRDRHELVALTARFGQPALLGSAHVVPNPDKPPDSDTGIFVPQPVRADLLLLSSLGASLKIHGKWAPPAAPPETQLGALVVSLWDQASQLGRDTKVVVEYKGFLFPLGHPATLIKETERRLFYDEDVGVIARLVQRFVIRVTPFTRQLPALQQPFEGRGWPFANITMPAFLTPTLRSPTLTEVIRKAGQQAFWPRIAARDGVSKELEVDFPFSDPVSGIEASAPLIFVDNDVAHDPVRLREVVRSYRTEIERLRYQSDWRQESEEARRFVARAWSGRVRFAPTDKPDKTSFRITRFLLDVDVPRPGTAKDVPIPTPKPTKPPKDPTYDETPGTQDPILPAQPIEEEIIPGEEALRLALYMNPSLEGQNQPPFYPHLRQGVVDAAQIAILTGGTRKPGLIEIDGDYLRKGFDSSNQGRIFLRFVNDAAAMEFSSNTSGSGGFANTSTIFSAVSEIRGPIGGSLAPAPQPSSEYRYNADRDARGAFSDMNVDPKDPVGKARAGGADPREFFGQSIAKAKLCGVVSFIDIVDAVLKASGARAPTIVQQLEHALSSDTVRRLEQTLQRRLEEIAARLEGNPALRGAVVNVSDQLARARNAAQGELLAIAAKLVMAIDDLRDRVNTAINDPKALLPSGALQVIDKLLLLATVFKTLEDPQKREEWVRLIIGDVERIVRQQAVAEAERQLAAYPAVATFRQRLRDANTKVEELRRGLATAPQDILANIAPQLNGLLDAAITARVWALWLDTNLKRLQSEAGKYWTELQGALQAEMKNVVKEAAELRGAIDVLKPSIENAAATADEEKRARLRQAFLEISDIALTAAAHSTALSKATTIADVAAAFGATLDSIAKIPRLIDLLGRLSDINVAHVRAVVLAFAKWVMAVAGRPLPAFFTKVKNLIDGIGQLDPAQQEALDTLKTFVDKALEVSRAIESRMTKVIDDGAALELSSALPFGLVHEVVALVAAALTAENAVRQIAKRAQLNARAQVVQVLSEACGRVEKLLDEVKTLIDGALTINDDPHAARWISPSIRARVNALATLFGKLPVGPTTETDVRAYLQGLDEVTREAARLAVEIGQIVSSGNIAALVNVRAALDEAIELIGAPTSAKVSYDWETDVREYPGGSGAVFIPKNSKKLSIHSKASVDLLSGKPPEASVEASLDAFSIRLLGSSKFLTLNFDPLTFSAGTGKSTVLRADVKSVEFAGDLSFVKKLQDTLQEKTGLTVELWKDGPGIVVGYQFNREIATCAAFVLQNIGFNISAILPFNSERARFRFGLSSPERPFLLSAGIYGGGGFVRIQSRADSIEYLEASFEYGLVTAFRFGPASGSGRITAGVYIRLGDRAARVGGFFNASGNADIAGLICISANFRVIIWYELRSGKVCGQATFSVRFKIVFAKFSFRIKVGYARQGESGSDSGGESDQRGFLPSSAESASALSEEETMAQRRYETANEIEADNQDKKEPDISRELLKAALWNRYWSAFEESIDECR